MSMKQISNTQIFIEIALLSFQHVKAQNDSLERSICFGLYNKVTAALAEDDAHSFYVAYQTTDTDAVYHRPYLAKLAELGGTIWQRIPFDSAYETGGVLHIHHDYDSNLIVSGLTTICDVVDGNGYVEKVMRSDGSRIWLKSFKRNKNFGNSAITLSDSTYWVTDGDGILHLDQNGDSINYFISNLGAVRKIMYQSDGYYIAQADSGLLRFNAAGSAINGYYTNLGINHAVVADSGNVFLNSSVAIFRVDSTLNGLLAYYPPANVTAITDMVDNENRLWILAQLNNNTSRLIKLSYDLTFLAGHTFNYFNDSDMTAQKILVNIHDYDLLFDEKLSSGQALVLKSWAKTGNITYHYNNDLGVTNIQIDSSYAQVNQTGGNTFLQAFMHTKVCVKNFGTRPANTFQLHALIPNTMGICAQPAYVIQVDTILNTNDSAWVDLGWLQTGYFDTIQNPFNLCFYTAAADQLMDYNHSNDQTCVTVSINTFTGWDEKILPVRLMPNPAMHQITISHVNSGNHYYKIIDTTGRMLMAQQYNSNQLIVNINKLHSGLYFVITDDGVMRLVKQ